MPEISPKELEELIALGEKIKAGKRLEQVVVTIEDEMGNPQELMITDPEVLHVLELAALYTYKKFCK